jgi:hypothetical protein
MHMRSTSLALRAKRTGAAHGETDSVIKPFARWSVN